MIGVGINRRNFMSLNYKTAVLSVAGLTAIYYHGYISCVIEYAFIQLF
jgi:hypothetical protein